MVLLLLLQAGYEYEKSYVDFFHSILSFAYCLLPARQLCCAVTCYAALLQYYWRRCCCCCCCSKCASLLLICDPF